MIELYPGMRVMHNKNGSSRQGWTGTVNSVETERFCVQWDNGTVQDYSDRAYYGEEHKFGAYEEGYIVMIGDSVNFDPTNYVVMGENGGNPQRVIGYENAVRSAHKRAQESKSGQAYFVCKPVEKFWREDPPIRRSIV